jgi:hypothetical protein
MPDDPRLGTVDSQGDTWTSVDGKGGIVKMFGGEVLDHDGADFYFDSRNGCNAAYGVTMEGSARMAIIVSPSPSVSLNVTTFDAAKWTSNADIAADFEVVQHEGQGPLNIRGSQFGLATAPVELCWWVYSPRDFAAFTFPGNEVSSPYRHGHFTGLYPDDGAVGSVNIQSDGTVTPLLYPWDGPAAKSLPGAAVPYTAAQWRALDNPVPDQWYACQETRSANGPTVHANPSYVFSLVKDRPRKDFTLRGNNDDVDTANLPVVGARRLSLASGAWHGRWIEFTGAVGQQLDWNDIAIDIKPDDFSVALDLLVDITAKPANDRFLFVLGGGGTDGLNVRVMNTGFLKVWCVSNSATGAVDMTTKGPTWLRFIYSKDILNGGASPSCKLITPYETLTPTYGATPGHTQHIGIGVNSSTSRAFTGFLRYAALYLRRNAEKLDTDLSRFGF